MLHRRYQIPFLLLLFALSPAFAEPVTTSPAFGEPVTIRGTVLRADQTGLPGAEIEVVPLLSNYKAQVALHEGRDTPPFVARATTDAAGRFVLDPGAGVWQVRVVAPGFVPMRYPMLPLANPVELPPVVPRPAAEAPMTVVDTAGRPLAGAGVYAESADAKIWRTSKSTGWRPVPRVAWSDAHGRFHLPRARGERLNLWVHLPGRTEIARVSEVRRARVVFEPMSDFEPTSDFEHMLRIQEPDGRAHAGMVSFARQIWPLGRANADGRLKIHGPLAEPLDLLVFGADSRLRKVTLQPPDEGGGSEVTATLSSLVPVAGRVVTAQGKPVAGAIIWPGHAPGAFTHCADDGRFELQVPKRERFRVQVHAPGFLPRSQIFNADPNNPPVLTVELMPAVEATGRVVDDTGRPLAGVRLAATVLDSEPRQPAVRMDVADARAVTDAEGRFELARLAPRIAYEIQATRPGFSSATFRVHADQSDEGLEMILTRGRGASGTVVDSDARPLAGVVVHVNEAGKQATAGPGRQPGEGDVDPFAGVTNEQGRFELRRLPASEIDLVARGTGFAPMKVRGLRIAPGDGPVDLGTLVLLPGIRLEGRILDAEEAPIAAAGIWVIENSKHTPALQQFFGEDKPNAVSNEWGRFEIADLEAQQTIDLLIDAPGFLPEALRRVTVPTEVPIEVVLRPAARVSGLVVDKAGRPIPGVRIGLDTVATANESTKTVATATDGEPPAERTQHSALSDEQGRFLVEDVAPGTVEAEAIADGYQPSAMRRFEIAAEEHVDDLRFTLAEGATLEGRVTLADFEPIAGVRVLVGRSAATSDADGRYRVTGIPPGTQSAAVRGLGYGSLRRELEIGPGVNEADFVLEGGHHLAGYAVDASDLPLAGVALSLEPLEDGVFGSLDVSSDENGAFRFEPVADGRYRIRGERRGYVEAAPLEVEVVKSPVDDLEIRLQTGAVIEGQILGLSFEELAQVSVRARAEERTELSGEVDYEGRYRIEDLAADDWTVEASLAGGSRQAQARATIEPGVPAVIRDLEFSGFVLTGQVLYQGEPQPETTLSAHGYDFPIERAVVTDFEGRFRIEDLRTGNYWLDLANHRQRLVHKEELTLAGDREMVIEIVAAHLSGKVSDHDTGKPLGDASVFLRQQSDTGRPGTVYGGPSDGQGVFSFNNLAAGRYRLEVMREGYSKTEQMLEVPAGAEIDGLQIALRAADGLDVAVALASGARPRFITLSGIGENGDHFTATRAADPTGHARFANLAAGRWQLIVGGTGGAVIETRATVPDEPLAVVLPDAGRLRVRVPELIESDAVAALNVTGQDGRAFRHLEWGGELQQTWSVIGGRVTVEGVPAGVWNLHVAAPDGRTWTGSAVTTGGPDVELRLD